ncbi:MAG: TMEM43 family protein [Verrucomicrobiales bacterium]
MSQFVERSRQGLGSRSKNSIGGAVIGLVLVVTYTYSREWREQPIDSSEFKEPEGHGNPVEMEYRSTVLLADDVSVGAFRLPEFLVARIGGAEPLEIRSLESASEAVAAAGILSNGDVYFGSDPASPAVGDIRVGYAVVRPGPVSVVARQQGDTLVSYVAKTGGKVDLLERGTLSAEEMFRSARDRNKAMTWAIRVGGFFVLAIGFSMILRPLVVFADILPFLGRIVGAGTTAISFLLAAIAWTVIVSLAWILHRPILGIVILAVTAGLIVLAFKKLRKADPVVPAASPPNDPPPPDAPPPFA